VLKLLSLVILTAAAISLPSFLPKTRMSPPRAAGSLNTESSVAQQIVNITNLYLAANPIDQLPGLDGTTLSSIYSSSLTNDQKAKKSGELMCGLMPVDLESIAKWRGCMAAAISTLMQYQIWKGDVMTNASAYQVLVQMDAIVTKNDQTPLSGLVGNEYRLGDTTVSHSYSNDFGTGVWSLMGWAKHDGALNQTYCTTLETPYDSGKGCKSINLFDRVAAVTSRHISNTNDYRQWPYVFSRQAAGRAVAAILNGDPKLRLLRVMEANDLVSRELGLDANAPVVWNSSANNFGVADKFQHAYSVLASNHWSLPDEFKTWGMVWYNNFMGSYPPIADIDNDSYLPAKIATTFPGAKIVTCGNLGDFYIAPSGVTTGIRGERLSDALMTSIPELYNMMKLSGKQSESQILLDMLARSLTSLTRHSPDWNDEMCSPDLAFGSTTAGKSHLQISLRTFSYYIFALKGIRMTGYSVFGSPQTTTLPEIQAASGYIFNNSVNLAFWVADKGYWKSIPASGNTILWNQASELSAPIDISSMPSGGKTNPATQGKGSITSQSSFAWNNSVYMGIWRKDSDCCNPTVKETGYSATIPLDSNGKMGTANWSAAATLQDKLSNEQLLFPGDGLMVSATDMIAGNYLYQGYWRSNLGYSRAIPFDGTSFRWSCQSDGTCPWSSPFTAEAGKFPGSGPVQTGLSFPLGNLLWQQIWRGNQSWWRTQNIVNGKVIWDNTTPWIGPGVLIPNSVAQPDLLWSGPEYLVIVPTRTPTPPPSSSNLIKNGNFSSGTANWNFNTNAAGSFTAPSGAAKVVLTTIGTNMQLSQPSLALSPSTKYTLSFSAYSVPSGKKVGVYIDNAASGQLGTSFTLSSSSWTTYSTTITTASSFPGTPQLRFWFVNSSNTPGDTYYLDNISLTPAGATAPTPTSSSASPTPTRTPTPAPSSSNLLKYPDFETDPYLNYFTNTNGTASFSWATDQKRSGSRSVKIVSTGSASSLSRWLTKNFSISTTPGKAYTGSVYVKTANTATLTVLFLENGTNAYKAGKSVSTTDTGGVWKSLSVTSPAAPANTYVRFEMRLTGPGTAWFDDASLN